MADLLQIVDFPYVGSRDRLVFDLADITHYAYAQGSLKPTAGAKTQTFSAGDSRYAGARQVDERIANGSLAWTVHVRGTSADDVAARCEAYLTQLDARAKGRYIKWQQGGVTGSGVSREVFSPVRGSATYVPDYDSMKFQGAWALDIQVTVPVAPLADWDCCDVEDRFDQDTMTLGDWTVLAGDGAFTVTPSAQPGGVPGTTGRKTFQHVGRGYAFSDWEVTVPFQWNGTTGAPDVYALSKILSANTNFGARTDGAFLYIFANVAGVQTDQGAGVTCSLTAGRNYWLRVRQRGYTMVAWVYNADPANPDVGSSNPSGNVVATKVVTLDGTSAPGMLGAGGVGWSIAGTTLANMPKLYGFVARPFTFPDTDAPQRIQTADAIPGQAPARVDVSLMSRSSSLLHTWAMLAEWAQRPRNLIRDGAFPLGSPISGAEWLSTVVTGRHAVATIGGGSSGNGPLPGTGSLAWSTAGSAAQEGIHAVIPHALQQGRTYSIRVLLKANSGTPQVNVLLTPADTAAALAVNQNVTLSSTAWADVRLDLIADTDYPDGAMLTIRNVGTYAATFHSVSGVVFTDVPQAEFGLLSRRQQAGHGGRTFGHLRANMAMVAPTGWARGTATGFTAHGEVLRDTAPAAATAYQAEWWIDGTALDPDDYADQVAMFVWIRWLLDPLLVAPRAILWTEPETSVNASNPGAVAGKRSYSTTGAAGKRLDGQPLGGAQRALWKPHGVIVIPTDPDSGRTRMIVSAQLSAGTAGTLFGVSDLLLVPAGRMQSTPTNVPNDSSYPRLTNYRPFEKRITSDGRGYLRQSINAYGLDTGMGGSAIELPAGARGELLVAAAENVPDDSTPAAVTDSYSLSTDVRLIVTPRSRLMRG